MSIDPRSLMVIQGMHNAANVLGTQEKFKARMQAAMNSIAGAAEFEALYHSIYRDFGVIAQSSGPEPQIGYDEAIALRGSVSFLRNLANGVIENCIGWYSEEVIANIFGASKVKEIGRGSTLDLLTP